MADIFIARNEHPSEAYSNVVGKRVCEKLKTWGYDVEDAPLKPGIRLKQSLAKHRQSIRNDPAVIHTDPDGLGIPNLMNSIQIQLHSEVLAKKNPGALVYTFHGFPRHIPEDWSDRLEDLEKRKTFTKVQFDALHRVKTPVLVADDKKLSKHRSPINHRVVEIMQEGKRLPGVAPMWGDRSFRSGVADVAKTLKKTDLDQLVEYVARTIAYEFHGWKCLQKGYQQLPINSASAIKSFDLRHSGFRSFREIQGRHKQEMVANRQRFEKFKREPESSQNAQAQLEMERKKWERLRQVGKAINELRGYWNKQFKPPLIPETTSDKERHND